MYMWSIAQAIKSEGEKDHDFYVVSDDDTLWSVDRLLDLLAKTDASKPLYMGERYAYVSSRPGGITYDYVTTGGGLVLTK